MLEQTKKLYEIFNEDQKNKVNSIIREIESQGSNYKTNKLWCRFVKHMSHFIDKYSI